MSDTGDLLARTDRDAAGRFVAGNGAALVHGRYAAVEASSDAFQAEHAARVEALMADAGGIAQLSASAQALTKELARVQLVCEAMGHQVVTRGPLTPKGQLRAVSGYWLALLDRQMKLAQQLGLERKTKPLTTAEVIQRAAVVS